MEGICIGHSQDILKLIFSLTDLPRLTCILIHNWIFVATPACPTSIHKYMNIYIYLRHIRNCIHLKLNSFESSLQDPIQLLTECDKFLELLLPKNKSEATFN